MDFPSYFTLAELLHSDTAEARGIQNIPTWEHMVNVFKTGFAMDKVRRKLGAPIKVNSGYRCAELNAAVGGSATSSHSSGLAVDFTCSRFGTPKEICDALWADPSIEFDQIIDEGTWVHIGFRTPMRRQYLKMTNGSYSTVAS